MERNGIPVIDAASLTEAISFIDQDHDGYAFRNNWLIDTKSSVKRFVYEDRQYVAKRSGERKAYNEAAKAKIAHDLLTGLQVGGLAVEVSLPKLVKPSLKNDSTYLVSEYHGNDLNEQYYVNEPPGMGESDWNTLVRLFEKKGIVYGGFLPRNTIVNSERIVLIDWEDAQFYSQPVSVDSLTRTTRTISWSYLFDIESIQGTQGQLSYPAFEVKQTGYEDVFGGYIGHIGTPDELRGKTCSMAVAAEADRKYARTNYKLDDVSQTIGELLPQSIEVLIDTLLARRNDVSHASVADIFGTAALALHAAGFNGQIAEADTNLFKLRCVKALGLLVAGDDAIASIGANQSVQSDFAIGIDETRIKTDVDRLAKSIWYSIIRDYPEAQPEMPYVWSVARDIGRIMFLEN